MKYDSIEEQEKAIEESQKDYKDKFNPFSKNYSTEEQIDKFEKTIKAHKDNNFDLVASGMKALNDRIDICRDRVDELYKDLNSNNAKVNETYNKLRELVIKIDSYENRILTIEKLLKIHNHYREDINE